MGALQRFPAPPPAAISRVLSTFGRAELEGFIAVAIDLLDLAEPDPDAEEIGLEDSFIDHPANGAGCPVADGAGDQAWIEWHQLADATKRTGGNGGVHHEDAEEDDEPEEDDPSGQCDEDGINTQGQGLQYRAHKGPGCEISDPGGCEHDGQEREGMGDDVPTLHVYSLAHNPFNDQRTLLGLSNLTTAFRGVARSANTGAEHNGRGEVRLPGVPV